MQHSLKDIRGQSESAGKSWHGSEGESNTTNGHSPTVLRKFFQSTEY